MGLDCYVLVKSTDSEEESRQELWYGRKENEIHGWMQRHSGIPAEDFNCVEFQLTPELIDQFEQALHHEELFYTPGFFFGGAGSQEQITEAATDLIKSVRQAHAEGKAPYYFSWW